MLINAVLCWLLVTVIVILVPVINRHVEFKTKLFLTVLCSEIVLLVSGCDAYYIINAWLNIMSFMVKI